MRIIIQAGHEGRTTGSIGSPNEQSFNIDISNKVADEMRSKGVEVRRVKADPTNAEISGDWDLFLSIHYDADIYGTGGYFSDFPEPTTDPATAKSQSISKILSAEYGSITKIVNHPERSNGNTRYYYMWQRISARTPCVLIECGVGMHVPDDHETLHFNRPLVVKAIVSGLVKSLNITAPIPIPPTPTPDIRLTLLNQAGILTEGDTRRAIDRDRNYPLLEAEKAGLEIKYNSLKLRIKTAVNTAIDSTV